MTADIVFGNAQLVLEDRVTHGVLRVADGRIVDIREGADLPSGALDCAGDFLAPGLIELHTDNLERHLTPRPGVDWPHRAAIIAHDRELAGCGITTVFDALRVGSVVKANGYRKYARPTADEILDARAAGDLKISHHLHLRAEICSETLLEELAEFGPDDRVGLVSLMDHTPGQRQFRDLEKLWQYHSGKYSMSRDEFADHVAHMQGLHARLGAVHEAGAVTEARRLGAVLASHDDTTEAQVAVSAGHGIRLAEFPTTLEAAQAGRAHGIANIMGAPNIVRGGSHSGNVSAAELADAGVLDILSSDYVPAALLLSAVLLGARWDDLARGMATVTAAPARAVGLADRGRLAVGLRADLARFRVDRGTPLVLGVWSEGARVA